MRDKAVYGLRVAHIALTAIAWIYIGATDTEEGAKAVSYGIIVGAVLAACTYFLGDIILDMTTHYLVI
jgi:hypothetical protein